MTPGHIHIRCERDGSTDTSFKSIDVLHISIAGKEKIAAFKELMAKAMNANYPNVDEDFRKLMDLLEFGALKNL